ncbi:uncharacterized protein E0L32_001313 [Thyridium curvatum]|uniref:Uncharacterized protein n=1 Tax=Thyridium curvatum TaxID=1093900 RepID=A0A507ATU0_9PEZI|nr:uncharacterized protein E0L32_001313 [Thyridium curvatum]TPX10116.1 hypothetical protein E0L32_001313 [Thyridium curvatum]
MRRTLPRLAARGSARTVSDATRFTQTTPHATSKPGAAAGAAAKKAKAAASRFPPAAASGTARSADGGRGRRPSPAAAAASAEAAPLNETPEQKVARLRAAHLAAKNAEVSAFDKFISSGRRLFDSAHKATVMGLIGFTAVAGLLTVYTTADMIMYNRKRKAEFLAAQEKMDADSLEAARLAYMRGDATEEQIALVEEANAAAEASGSHIFKMPGALTSSSSSSSSSSSEAAIPSPAVEAAITAQEQATTEAAKQQKPGSWRSWIFANLKNEEEGEDVGTSEARLGYESLSEDDDNAIVRDSDVIRAIEDKQAYLKEKARAALDKEKENQRKGGPLDRVGIDAAPAAAEKPAKKWWIF